MVIVGADGFIGSAVVRAALGARMEVTAISLKAPWRLRDVCSARLADVRVDGGRWWLPERDLSLTSALREADSVALLAYTPPAPEEKRKLQHERAVNVRGAKAVAEIAGSTGARLVFTSSADVYGPWREDPVCEAARAQPASPYAVAKIEAEQAVQEACDAATCLRIATVYGPGENGTRAIPSFIRALARGKAPVVHGDGGDIRDYVYVGDVAAAIVSAITASGGPGICNLGSGVGRSTISVLEAVGRVMSRPVRPRHVSIDRAPSRLVLDTSTAARELRFRPRVEFHEGLQTEVRWLLSHLSDGSRCPNFS